MKNEQRTISKEKSIVAERVPLHRSGPSEWRSRAEVGVRLDKMSYELLKPKLSNKLIEKKNRYDL